MSFEQPQNIDTNKQAELERQKRQKEWDEIRGRVEGTKDKLELGIDEGIKEGVTAFNAFGLRTSQSCEGHYGTEEGGSPTPWIEVAPQEPDTENWYEDDELREKVIKERNELQVKSVKLLDEFYKERGPSFDARLGFFWSGL